MLLSQRVMMTATPIRSLAERCECAGLRGRLICRCPGMNGLRLQSAFSGAGDHRRHRTEAVERRARGRNSVEEMAPLSQREVVGHRPRGLRDSSSPTPARVQVSRESSQSIFSAARAHRQQARTVWSTRRGDYTQRYHRHPGRRLDSVAVAGLGFLVVQLPGAGLWALLFLVAAVLQIRALRLIPTVIYVLATMGTDGRRICTRSRTCRLSRHWRAA